jgi:hypothetical protein
MQYFLVLPCNYSPKPACRGYMIHPSVLPQDPDEKSRKEITCRKKVTEAPHRKRP